MKKISGLFIIILLSIVSLVPHQIFAATQYQLSLNNITLSSQSYKSGDKVMGTFTVQNQTNGSQTQDLRYQVSLVGKLNSSGLPLAIYDQGTMVPFIATQGTQTINFSYTLPTSIAKDAGYIQIHLFSPSGQPLNWSTKKITITDAGSAFLNVTSAEIMVGNSTFTPNSGPTISTVTPGSLNVVFTNDTNVPDALTAHYDVYDFKFEGNPVKSGNVSYKASSKNLTWPLPILSPGVYVGKLSLSDSSNVKRSQDVTFRYIVKGDIATVKEATLTSSPLTAGLVLTGTPDVITQFASTSSDPVKGLQVAVTVSVDGKTVAEGHSIVTVANILATNVALSITDKNTLANAKSVHLNVTLSKDGRNLDVFSTDLPPPVPSSISTVMRGTIVPGIVMIVLGMILTLLTLYFLYSKKQNIWLTVGVLIIITSLYLIVSLLLWGISTVNADNGDPTWITTTYVNPINVSEYFPQPPIVDIGLKQPDGNDYPIGSNGPIIPAGATFNVGGSVMALKCGNEIHNAVTRTCNDSTCIQDDSLIAGVVAPTSSETYYYSNDFSEGSFTAASTPGNHTVTYTASNLAYFNYTTYFTDSFYQDELSNFYYYNSTTQSVPANKQWTEPGTSLTNYTVQDQGPGKYSWYNMGTTIVTVNYTVSCPSGQTQSGNTCVNIGTPNPPSSINCTTAADCGGKNSCGIQDKCISRKCQSQICTPSSCTTPATCSPVVLNASLNIPPVVNNPSDTCTLTWSASNGGNGHTLTCSLDGNAVNTASTQNILVGKHTISCTDGITSASSSSQCVLNPSFNEF